MNGQSIWIRCRDGSLRREPVLTFTEGFIYFGPDPSPVPVHGGVCGVLVTWIDRRDAPPAWNIVDVLRRVFGDRPELPSGCAANLHSLGYVGDTMIPIPGTNPPHERLARLFPFILQSRIPRPQIDLGTERYPRNCAGGIILDFTPNPRDAYELDFPQ